MVYSDNAGVAFIVADVSLAIISRLAIDGSQLTLAFSSPLYSSRSSLSSADSTVLSSVFSVGGVHRSSTSSRALPCPLPFLLQANLTSLCNLSSLSNAVVITERKPSTE